MARGWRPPRLILGIMAGFAVLAALALGAPEPPPPERTFVWGRVETLIGWPIPETAYPPPPTMPPSDIRKRYSLVPTTPLPLAPGALHEWSPRAWDGPAPPDPQTYQVGEVRITVGSAAEDRASTPVTKIGALVVVEAPGIAPYSLRYDDTSSFVDFGVGRIDMTLPGPQVLIGVYTGGSRCCTRYRLIAPDGAVWRETILEETDHPLTEWPTDRDGDGVPELLLRDSYGSQDWPAPLFLQIEAGKVVRVSERPGFTPFLRDFLKLAEAACRQHDNDACMAFVLVAARLGEGDRAWRVMLRSYDRDSYMGERFPDYLRSHLEAGARAEKNGTGR